jgi:hypothetical protein
MYMCFLFSLFFFPTIDRHPDRIDRQLDKKKEERQDSIECCCNSSRRYKNDRQSIGISLFLSIIDH